MPSCYSTRNYYYGPNIDPGLQTLIHPVKAAAGNLYHFIQYRAMRDPVLPSPALQWMAMAPSAFSASSKNFCTILGFGVVPSMKNSSRCLMPFFRNRCIVICGVTYLSVVDFLVQPHNCFYFHFLEDGRVVFRGECSPSIGVPLRL